MDAFVAAPKTFIVERLAGERAETHMLHVVGWVYVQGTVAYPISPIANGGLTDRRAVLMPDGVVLDRALDTAFPSLEAWEAHIDEHGSPLRTASTDPESVIEDRPRTADGLRKAAADAIAAAKTVAPARKPKKVKTLQQKSFWGSKTAMVILLAEGGTELPDDRDWMKITRDEFAIRKRDGYVVWADENGPPSEDNAAAADASNFDDLI